MIERINLLPDELKKDKRRRAIRRFLILFTLIYIGILGSLYFHQDRLLKVKEDVIVSLTRSNEVLLRETAEYNRLVEKINLTKKREKEIKERTDVIGSLIRSRIYWAEITRRITLLVPDELWLTSLTSYDTPNSQSRLKKGIKFTGTAFSNSRIGDFSFALENSTVFENVFLSYSRKRVYLGRDLFDFELTADLKSQGL